MAPSLVTIALSVVGLSSAEHLCSGAACDADEDETTLLALRASHAKASRGIHCPGSPAAVQCSGDECCPAIPQAGNKTFPCSNAKSSFSGCQSGEAPHMFDYVTCITAIPGGGDCTGCQGEQCSGCFDDRLSCCLDHKCRGAQGEQVAPCRADNAAACCLEESVPIGMCPHVSTQPIPALATEDSALLLDLRASSTKPLVHCPGAPAAAQCSGNECCPGVPQTGNKSFPCSNAKPRFGCQSGHGRRWFDYVTCITEIPRWRARDGQGCQTGCQGWQCSRNCLMKKMECCIQRKCRGAEAECSIDRDTTAACCNEEKARDLIDWCSEW